MEFAPLYAPNPNPHINEWHNHNPPPGTAYHPLPRMNHPSLTRIRDAVSRLEELHALAPYDTDISYNLLRIKFNSSATLRQYTEVYQPVLDYDAYSLNTVAQAAASDREQYEKLMMKAANLDPFRYYTLAESFMDRGEDDKAAVYLEKGMQLCSDAVAAANHANWLVKYYLRKGMTQKANRLADAAANVYSQAGLKTKAELLESTGKYAEAMDYYLKIEERYKESGVVAHFITRYKSRTGDSRYEEELNKRLKKLFPRGLEKVGHGDFQGPPPDGVVIGDDNELLRNARLGRGDIIVAVYGIRVHNFEQYDYARDASSNLELDLLVWKENHYVSLKASPPEHRFKANFTTYTAR